MAYNWIPKKTHPRRPGHPPAAGKTHNQNRLILLVLLLVLLVLLLLSSPHGNAGSAGNHGACRFASCSKKQLACVEKPRPEKFKKKGEVKKFLSPEMKTAQNAGSPSVR